MYLLMIPPWAHRLANQTKKKKKKIFIAAIAWANLLTKIRDCYVSSSSMIFHPRNNKRLCLAPILNPFLLPNTLIFPPSSTSPHLPAHLPKACISFTNLPKKEMTYPAHKSHHHITSPPPLSSPLLNKHLSPARNIFILIYYYIPIIADNNT